MATIRARKCTDGSISYTAQIRLIREGAQVYQESQTFARKQAAQARVAVFCSRWIGIFPGLQGSQVFTTGTRCAVTHFIVGDGDADWPLLKTPVSGRQDINVIWLLRGALLS